VALTDGLDVTLTDGFNVTLTDGWLGRCGIVVLARLVTMVLKSAVAVSGRPTPVPARCSSTCEAVLELGGVRSSPLLTPGTFTGGGPTGGTTRRASGLVDAMVAKV
jgi:hypothetical protein